MKHCFVTLILFQFVTISFSQNISNVIINSVESHFAYIKDRDSLFIKDMKLGTSAKFIKSGLAGTSNKSGLSDERFLVWNDIGTQFIFELDHHIYIYDVLKNTTLKHELPANLLLFKYYRINQVATYGDYVYFSAGDKTTNSKFQLFKLNLLSGLLEAIATDKYDIANVCVSKDGQYLAYSYYESNYDKSISGVKILTANTNIIVYEKEFVSKSFLSNLSFINKGLLLVRNVYGKSHVLNFTENKAYAVQQDFSVDSTGYLLKSINATHILSMNLDKDKRTYKSFNLENRNSQTLLKKKNSRLLHTKLLDQVYEIYYLYENGKTPKQLFKREILQNGEYTEKLICNFEKENPLKRIDYQLFEYFNSDNQKSKAFMYLPQDTEKLSKPLPLIIMVYGGYTDTYPDMNYFMNEVFFKLIEKGFALVLLNTNGYANSRVGDEYGKKQLLDTELFIKSVRKQYPILSNKVFAVGHSHGATMVYYYLTHSDTFAGGVAINGAADWIKQAKLKTMTGLPGEMGGTPNEVMDKYKMYSPIENITSKMKPLLIVAGTDDTQIPSDINSIEFNKKALELGINSQLLYFLDEGHLIKKAENKLELAKRIESFMYMAFKE